MSKIMQINSHVDRRVSPAFFQVEIIEIDAETREINPVELINSHEIEEQYGIDSVDTDCEVKLSFIYNYLIDNYNYFDKGEQIHIFGYDIFIKNFIKRINQITLKLQFPIMKTHYKKKSIEEFVDILVDRYALLDKRNKTYELARKGLIKLIPVIMNSPRKEIIYHTSPISRSKFNKGEYNELEEILFLNQSELVTSTKKVVDKLLDLSPTQIATQIKNSRNRKRNKMKRLQEEGKIWLGVPQFKIIGEK